ncbi:hypothetical protein [Micromonospora sp. NPDC005367]|uniref:hypothetical protein n=1 Tax=Micromonospora sp. NPDC005367 TaxID=3155590 RepID=UPI0033BF518B
MIRSHVSSFAGPPVSRCTPRFAPAEGAVLRLDVEDRGPERDGGQYGRTVVGE